MPTAMFRGNIFDASACKWHETALTGKPFDPPFAVLWGLERVLAVAKEEGRPVTGAAYDARLVIAEEVTKALTFYVTRVAPMVHKPIATQVPIRVTIDVDGEPQDFASHLDLLWRDAAGWLHVWDWKWRDESPTQAYLDRNMQLNLYRYAMQSGVAQVDGEWVEFNEDPIVEWIHVPSLFPYAKGTAEHKKGDDRPVNRIVMAVGDGPLEWVISELEMRTRMARAGHWPTNPDPVGCHICDSKQFCPSSYRSSM